MFTIELLQKINDWQSGGNAKQNKKRGVALKEAVKNLPVEFRQADKTCYRQVALTKKYVWIIGTELQLAEKISSWTECLIVAKAFKGGVPPPGYQGVIFHIQPPITSVIVNLNRLYNNTEFTQAIGAQKDQITGYSNGIGKYWNSQQEVVVEKESLPLNSIHSWGGYVEPRQRLMKLSKMYYGRTASDEELVKLEQLINQVGHDLGPSWLSTTDAVKRVSEKLVHHGKRLSKLRANAKK
jgi:hypothetical protein